MLQIYLIWDVYIEKTRKINHIFLKAEREKSQFGFLFYFYFKAKIWAIDKSLRY